jgi:hypothetical protein
MSWIEIHCENDSWELGNTIRSRPDAVKAL